MANLKDIGYGVGKYLEASDASDIPDIGTNRKNLDLLNFKVATNNAYSLYNFKDGMLDAYQTSGGVDASASTNETYNSSGKYYSGAVIGTPNYFGDSSDGALSTSGNVTHTVQNASGFDGDMVIKQYTNLTINSGHTMTVDDNCRGMLLYVNGDFVLNGTISMDGKGAHADPTAAGASDNAAVNAAGLQLPMYTDSGSDTLASATFAGTGTAVVAAVANQPAISGNGTIFSVARVGGAGGAVKTDTGGYAAGNVGTDGVSSGTTALALTGGGGSGAAHFAHSGAGGAGTCFSGGSAGGGSQGPFPGPYPTGNDGSSIGGAGGAGTATGSAHGPQGAGGGAGQPGGSQAGGSGATSGSTGNGGVIWIIVKGNVSGSGTITSDGTNGGQGANVNGPNGGGSGAGGCIILCAGTDSSSFTNGMAGGSGGTAHSYPHQVGGAGGAGGLVRNSTLTTVGPEDPANLTLISNAQTAQAAPTTGRLMIYEEASTGSVTLNTDLKGYVSRDNGTTYTQVTLADDTTYETGKRLVSGSVDISGQPSGTNIKYKIETLNQSATKVCRLHGASLLWA